MFYLIWKISSFLIKKIWTKESIKINFQQIWKLLLSLDKKKYWSQLHTMRKKHMIFTELILGSWKVVKSYVDGLSICLLQQGFE